MNARTAYAAAFDQLVGGLGERGRAARIGCLIQRASDGETLFARDAQQFFQGASTTKVPSVASALATLGEDFRFRTVVRHTGHIDDAGTLHGDLVLVAAGDPNLSARVRPDGTLAFTDVDHVLGSYFPDATAVPGDPLVVLRTLAATVARTVKHVTGRVCIDLSVFPEGPREMGTSVVVSPIVVNDNTIDLMVRAGSAPGEPLALTPQPATSYVSFVCEGVTGERGGIDSVTLSDELRDEDTGARTVRVRGSLPPGTVRLYAHPVETPSAFARTAFVEVLGDVGVRVDMAGSASSTYRAGDAPLAEAILAEHWSPRFVEAAKVMLKVSQNMHTELCPRAVGAYAAGVTGAGAEDAGFAYVRAFLRENAVDRDGGFVQGDAHGQGWYTPAFMCGLLRAIAAHPALGALRGCLPVLGRDGTLASVVPDSPAAGHVVAKTGTSTLSDRLERRAFVTAKGLAGYIDAASGEHLVFAAYVNNLALEPGETTGVPGTLLGRIAATAYDLF